MVIYIDVLIFLNVITNYCILCATRRFLNLKTKYSRLILGSFVASLFTLTVFLNINSAVFSILIKIVCVTLMCFISFFRTDFFTYIKIVCTTFVFTIVFSAVAISYYQIFKPRNMVIVNDMVYVHIKPISLIIISAVIYILFLFLKKLLSQNTFNSLVTVKMLLNNKEYTCIGKIDTGNSVVEPFSGSPVIIAEKSLFPDIDAPLTRVIPYSVLGNSGILHGIKAEKIFIDNKEVNKEIYIGIYDGQIDLNFKSIINSNILR